MVKVSSCLILKLSVMMAIMVSGCLGLSVKMQLSRISI